MNTSTKPGKSGEDHGLPSNTGFQETAFQKGADDPSSARVSLAANTVGANTAGKALLITGTDTNVGKTWVTCLIARQLMACGLRVVQASLFRCDHRIDDGLARDDNWDLGRYLPGKFARHLGGC